LKASDENNDDIQKAKIDQIQEFIDLRVNPKTEMTQTGLVVVLHEVTERLYEDLLTMLPMSLGIVLSLMIVFHRNWLAVPVVLVPIFCSLIWILGIVNLSGVVLTPMIVAAGPILVGIGVATQGKTHSHKERPIYLVFSTSGSIHITTIMSY
jgi:predicted RND superfamily exporter protein